MTETELLSLLAAPLAREPAVFGTLTGDQQRQVLADCERRLDFGERYAQQVGLVEPDGTNTTRAFRASPLLAHWTALLRHYETLWSLLAPEDQAKLRDTYDQRADRIAALWARQCGTVIA